MVKFKTFIKLQLRMLAKTKSRFISIFVITMIGAAFFAGLRITPTVMNATTDAYLDQQKYADLTLIPTYGVTEEDIEEIRKIDGVEAVEGIYFFDVEMELDKDSDGLVVYSYTNDFNAPYLVEGRLIENENECIVDLQYKFKRQLELGDVITVSNENGSKELEIVGFSKDVRQILYYKRGANAYGNGTSQGFLIMHPTCAKDLALNQDLVELLGYDDFYNEAVIKLYDVDEMVVFNEDYDDYLNRVEADIDEVISIRLNKTYQELIADKMALLEEPEREYQEGLAQYESGKLEFEKAISDAELQLIQGKIAILEGRKQLVEAQSQFTGIDTEIASIIGGLQSKLTDLYSELKDFQEELNTPEDELNPDMEEELPDSEDGEETLPDSEEGNQPFPDNEDGEELLPGEDLPDNEDLEEELPSENDELTEEEIIEEINQTIDEITNDILSMNATLSDLNALASGLLQLQNAQLQLDKAEIEIAMGEQALTLQKELGLKELEEAKQQLDEAKVLLDDAREQIDLIPKGTYFLLDQNMNEGIASFAGDSQRIGVIGELFPLMFFLVAALVCLTTMTRMVEEQRAQSGTLRALGYPRHMIVLQYVVYAIIPTFLGSIIGYFIGTYILPMIIYSLYAMMMYDVPLKMVYCFDEGLFILSIAIAVVVTLVATLFSCVREMSHVPAILMRPKAPKLGKRILLERVTWIWKRLNFNQKVTMRNIFRYKKRFLMSVIGIAGCSGLILTGFGIQYSITDMTVYQYEELSLYDGTVSYQKEYTLDETLELRDDLKSCDSITEILFTSQKNIVTLNENDQLESTLFIPSSSNKLDRFINLRDYETKETLQLNEEGAILTQKMSEMLEVEVGDYVSITFDETNYEIFVSGITENYIGHIVYMSEDYAKEVFKEETEFNSACFNIDETSEAIENQIGHQLMENENVSSVSFMSNAGGAIVKQLKSVSIVTYVLIIAAGLLAFVVLYNLTNININERITEIATIKVLGFRNHEVYDYVFRENIMLSIIGTMVGLVFGIFLHRYIMGTVEVELIMFVRQIKWVSYIYAIVLTMSFTLLINRYMRRVLNRVDMVTSLKSIE